LYRTAKKRGHQTADIYDRLCRIPGLRTYNTGHNGKKDFSAIIEMAKTLPAPVGIETGSIVGGFAHSQVLALADKVV
jgi:hydroxylamine reductase